MVSVVVKLFVESFRLARNSAASEGGRGQAHGAVTVVQPSFIPSRGNARIRCHRPRQAFEKRFGWQYHLGPTSKFVQRRLPLRHGFRSVTERLGAATVGRSSSDVIIYFAGALVVSEHHRVASCSPTEPEFCEDRIIRVISETCFSHVGN